MARILDRIDRPQDLHDLPEDELVQVAQEVREHIIDTVGEIGGHFGANLGTCELAVALHSLLDSPTDKIVWDVGHQAYPHKVLTGRRDQLPTIRQYEGLAPFCSIAESEHDIMGAGHASTSIGYAVGLKEAMRLRDEPDAGKVVAVIGDGAMTGGVAFEAIHQAGGLGTPIVVVLNDNGMSIAPNVGALSRYFNRVRLNPKLWHAREGVENKLTELPGGIGAAFERLGPQLKESFKSFWAPGLFWEELDWAYTGVIDGHDLPGLRRALRQALAADRPVVVHIATVKGKGFAPAEEGGLEGMERWHAAKPGSIVSGAAVPSKPVSSTAPPQYTQVFGKAMVHEVRRDPRVAGLVGDDGPTHHGAFDIAYLRCLPNIVLMAPRDEAMLMRMLRTALTYDGGPIALRYPRGEGVGVPMPRTIAPIEIGRGEVLREGDRVAIVGYGTGVQKALEAADLLAEGGLDVTVADARFAKPLDGQLLGALAAEHELLVTVEEGVLAGGFGSAVWECLNDAGGHVPRILRVGLPDRYVAHGKPALLHAEVGFTGKAIAQRIEAAIAAGTGELARA